MEEIFELDLLTQAYLDENCDKEGKLTSEKMEGLISRIVRTVRYDTAFDRDLLKNTIEYIEQHYPNIFLWEKNMGEFPILDEVTEEQFNEQTALLKQNFSHERVDWLKQAGQKLYGKKTEMAKEPPKQEKMERKVLQGESNRQQSQQSHRRATASASKQASHKQLDNSKSILGILVIAIVAVIIYLLSD